MSHHWRNKDGINEIMSKRPYQEINKPIPAEPRLFHAIMGVIILGLLIFLGIFLAHVFQLPALAPVNDRAPALERMGAIK